MSAAGSARSAGRCTSTPCPAAGRDPTRRRAPPSPASSSGSPTTPSCCSTDWSPRRPPRCWCRRRAGCGWSCSCTCRWATARQMTRPTTPGRGSARSSRSPLPSSRPARGPGAGCWSCTRCRPTGCTSPSPAVDAADLATGTAAGGALLCVAAVTSDKGHDVLLDALATTTDLSWHCVCVGSLDRDPAFVAGLRRRSLDGRAGRPGVLPGTTDRSRSRPQLRRRGPAGAGVARRDVRHGRHRGAGPRPAGRRGRRRRACRRRSVTAPTGSGRGCWSRPTTRRHSAPRSGPGSATPSCEGGCAGPPASGASRSPGGRPPRPSSQASWPGRRDDRRGHPGQLGDGSPCASLPTPRPVRPTSSSTSGGTSRRPAAG